MILSVISFSMMSFLVKWTPTVDFFTKTFYRFIVGLGILTLLALLGKIELKFNNHRLLFLRGVIGSLGALLFFIAISKIGVGKGSIIFYSYPIFASIISVILLGEKIGIQKIVAIITAFLGIYFLSIDKLENFSTLFLFGKYELLAILGAVCGGTAVVFIKKLHDTDSTYAIFYAQCVMGMWIVLLPASSVANHLKYSEGLLLIGIGVLGTLGQIFMTQGYKYTTVSTGSILGMLTPVINFSAGFMLFDEPYTIHTLIGSLVVIVSCIFVIASNEKNEEII